MATFRDIVVDASPRGDLAQTLEAAKGLAKVHDARLIVASYAWPRASIIDALLHSAQQQRVAMEEALEATRRAFDCVFIDDKVDVEWRSGVAEPATAMRSHLLTADLLITDGSEDDGCVSLEPTQAALDAGIPVLRLGRQPARGAFLTVLVAWKDSPQARRAVHDALPILVKAESVAVVGVGEEIAKERLDMVVTHLRRHGVRAQHRHVATEHGSVSESLLAQARRVGAQLVVSGIYSRGELTERVLGGVTADLLRSTELSWLMSR
jgi:nucleotide-binding universal stress UspA family protein